MVSQSKYIYKKTLNRIAFMLTASLLVNFLLSILLISFGGAVNKLDNDYLASVLLHLFELIFYVGFYSLTLLAFKGISEDADEEFILRKASEITKPDFIRPFLYCFAVIATVQVVATLNSFILSNFETVNTAEILEENKTGSILVLILTIISTAVLPGIFEELIFRKIIAKKLLVYGEGFAIVVSALLFGFWHGNIYQIPYATVAGLVLGTIYIKTGNIYLSMTAHFANNLFATLFGYFTSGLGERESFIAEMIACGVWAVLGILSGVYILLTHKKRSTKIPDENEGFAYLKTKTLVGGIFTSCVFLFFLVCIAEAVLTALNIGGMYG